MPTLQVSMEKMARCLDFVPATLPRSSYDFIRIEEMSENIVHIYEGEIDGDTISGIWHCVLSRIADYEQGAHGVFTMTKERSPVEVTYPSPD